MALIPRKTYPELTALTAPVVDGDVLAAYRSPGPLRRLTASTFADYIKAFFSASSGSALIGFIQSGTGAAAETVQTALRRTVYSDQYATPQQAITAASSGGTVIFRAGGTTTLTTPLLLTGLNNVRLVGYGHTMQCGATRINSYIDASGSSGTIVEGFLFDGKQSSMPVYTQADFAANQLTYNTPVIANGTVSAWSNLTVRNCTLTGMYTNAVWTVSGTGLVVEGNTFNVPVCNQTYLGTPAAQQWICVVLQTLSGKVSITNNSFLGATTTNPALPPCAVFASGITGSLYIGDNRAEYCGRDNTGTHRLGVFDVYGDAVNVTIESNTAVNVMAQFGRLSAVARGKVLHNNVVWSANAEFGYNGYSVESTVVFGGQQGCQDILIEGNSFNDPDKRHATVISLLAYDYDAPLTDVRVVNNDIPEAAIAINLAGPYYNVTIRDNSCDDYTIAGINVQHAPGGVTLTGTEANGLYDQLFIHNNFFRQLVSTGANGIQHSLGVFTTAKVGYSEIIGNQLEALTGVGSGIIVLGYSTNTARNRIIIRSNHIVGYNYYVYWRDGGYYLWEDNNCSGAATAPYLDGGGYLGLQTDGNRLTVGGILRGTATLVAGTVTVSSTEIQTGDTVMLTRKAIGGTVGQISLGTITNATSFVINSDNAADTSSVFWQIVH